WSRTFRTETVTPAPSQGQVSQVALARHPSHNPLRLQVGEDRSSSPNRSPRPPESNRGTARHKSIPRPANNAMLFQAPIRDSVDSTNRVHPASSSSSSVSDAPREPSTVAPPSTRDTSHRVQGLPGRWRPAPRLPVESRLSPT